MNPSLVFDIETEDWTKYVVGAAYDGHTVSVFHYDSEKDFVDFLLAQSGEVYAHNGGRFDTLWLLDAMDRYGLNRPAKVIANSSGVIALKLENVTFLDSYRIFPLSLRKLSNGQKRDLSDLCHCGKECGGYCAIRRDCDPAIMRRIVEYLEADVRELWNALDYFAGFAESVGLELGMTIGSTAWKSAAAELALDPQPFKKLADWKQCRQGYYGGRAELFRRSSPAGHQYDVNSMYPAKISAVALPVGYTMRAHGATAGRCYSGGMPGIYSATVDVPDMFIPPLPIRVEKPYHRIVYPYGRIDGTWTALELQYAESLGCRIEHISQGIVFERGELIFASWVARLFNVRMKYGKDTREGAWLKWILNSLTGKFGARCDFSTILIDPEEIKVCSCHQPDCTCGAYYPVNGSMRVFEIHHERLQKCAHVEWAGYLTSAARVELHRQLTAGPEDAVYCDTDSVFCEVERTERIGNELGQWKPEGPYRDFIAAAPKVYCYTRGDKTNVKAKGIPNPDWSKIESGAQMEYWSMAGLRGAVNGKFFARVMTSRTVKPNTGARLPDGPIRTRPMSMVEVNSVYGENAQ